MARKRILHEIRALEDLAGVRFDVIWNFDDSVFFDLSGLPDDVHKILHIMDEGQDYQLKRAASTSDISFGVTPFIVEKLRKSSSKGFLIGHGLDGSATDEAIELPGSSPYKAVFAGNLSAPLLDWKTLYHSIKDEDRIDLCLIGPGKDEFDQEIGPTMRWKAKIQELPNTFFLGTKPSDQLLSYYRAADLLLLARLEGYKQVANSHKLLEYLYSGKCVVATFTHCYEGVDDTILRMTSKNEEFPDLLKDTVEHLEYYNSPELREKRKAYALQFTYENRIQEIEEYLEKVMEEKVDRFVNQEDRRRVGR
jgi:glycosyltransferase involved in cell wall biosynthesis